MPDAKWATNPQGNRSARQDDQLSSLSLLALPVLAFVDLATELEERRSSSLRLRLRSVSRVLSRTPHLASCFITPRE